MTLIWFNGHETEELMNLNTLDLESKISLINKVNYAVSCLLKDYIKNEEFCIQWEIRSLPQSRVYKLDELYKILQLKTSREIIDILHDDLDRLSFGTNESRKYLLKKFNLWTGEYEEEGLSI